MSDPLSLRQASVQDIQLELLRRTRFNALDGEQVHASLRKHQHLWLAVLLDRPGVPDYREPGLLLLAGLIKLRDLPQNLWNADTLFVLTRTHDDARALAQIAEETGVGKSLSTRTRKRLTGPWAPAGGVTDCCPYGGTESALLGTRYLCPPGPGPHLPDDLH